MSDIDTLINVENAQIEAVENAAQRFLGPAFFMDSVPHVAGLHLFIQDLSDEINYAKALLEERHLTEPEPFLRQFDISGLNVEIRFFSDGSSTVAALQYVLADSLAQHPSSVLRCRALVRLDNGTIPFRLYDCGTIAADFKEYYQEYMKEMPWIPAE